MLLKSAGKLIRQGAHSFELWRELTNSRKRAHQHAQKVVQRKGYSVLNRALKNRIKEYSADIFGSEAYWPWLACYTEIRGEFKEGWMPDDHYTTHLIRKLNPFTEAMVSTLKSMDHRIFGDMAVRPVALLISGLFYDSGYNLITKDQFFDRMNKMEAEVVVKLDGGPSGKGLFFRQSGELTPGDFQKGQNYLVQPVIEQHPTLSRLNESSLNTVRVVTLINQDQEIRILYGIIKFGSEGSRIDNIGQGGRFLVLNRNGTVTGTVYNNLGLQCNEKDIESGFDYKNFSVPSFNRIRELCLNAHRLFPHVRLIGWDVAVQIDGTPILVEWNARCPDLLPEEAIMGPVFPDIGSLLE